MPTMALRAHYDDKHIVLDEYYELARDTPLLVIPMSNGEPVAQSKNQRIFGAMRGKAVVSAEFFEPLPENELDAR